MSTSPFLTCAACAAPATIWNGKGAAGLRCDGCAADGDQAFIDGRFIDSGRAYRLSDYDRRL